jgi:hypothetical protein
VLFGTRPVPPMKTVIKLLVAIAFLNGVVRIGLAEAKYYQFKDQSQQLVTFGAESPVGELQDNMLANAAALELPIASEDIEVTRNGQSTRATASYTQPVEVFPNYTYPLTFQFTVEGMKFAGAGPGAFSHGK